MLGWRVCLSPSCRGSGTAGAPSQGDILSHSQLWQRQRLSRARDPNSFPGAAPQPENPPGSTFQPQQDSPCRAGDVPGQPEPLALRNCNGNGNVFHSNYSPEPGQPPGISSASALALLTCPKYLNPRVSLAWGETQLGHLTAGVTPGLPGQDEVARDVGQAVPGGPWQCQFGGCHPLIPGRVWLVCPQGRVTPEQEGLAGTGKARP